jgi:acetyl-CoA/propionyl-CoA carboxylase carboxyl transferase subunit
MGGAMGVEGCGHIVAAYDTAISEQSPIVGIWHSGWRPPGRRRAGAAPGRSGLRGDDPRFGPRPSDLGGRRLLLGGAAYGPALTDVIVMAPESRVFVTGPDVVRSVTGEDVDMASLGGPDTHHKKSGARHIVADDENDAYAWTEVGLDLFCQQGHFDRGKAEAGDV